MIKNIKNIFSKKQKKLLVDEYNLLDPLTNVEMKFQMSCHLLYEVLVEMKIIKVEKNNQEKSIGEFTQLYFDHTGSSDHRMYAYFKMIEGLNPQYFNHIQTQEAINLWEVFTLKTPMRGEDTNTMDYRFACNTIHEVLIKNNIIEDDSESYAKVCKAILTPTSNDLKYPLLRTLIDYPEATDKKSKLHKALNIYIKLQDEQEKELA